MKRAPELRDLSDHHHRGLVQARRLRKAATGDEANPPEGTAEAFLEFWQEGTTAHFREEEEVLLPVLARYTEDLLGRDSVVEMLLQHARIRGLVMGLSDEVKVGGVRPQTLGSIGELLEAHIRLEEREVFPTIEEALPEEALREVSARLEAKRGGRTPSRGSRRRACLTTPCPDPATARAAATTGPREAVCASLRAKILVTILVTVRTRTNTHHPANVRKEAHKRAS
jgi:hemerythrin-like domain-containing protein